MEIYAADCLRQVLPSYEEFSVNVAPNWLQVGETLAELVKQNFRNTEQSAAVCKMLRQMAQICEQSLLTKKQFAELLQVSTRTVDRWLSEDRLPEGLRVEIAGTVRFRQDIAAAWVAAGCPQSGCDLRDAKRVDQ